MRLLRVSSPHTHGPLGTQQVMLQVLLATLPGVTALCWFFGPGVLVNILWGCLLALAFEAVALLLRGRRPLPWLGDCSALVTATLLCIALPPGSPWWLIAVGIASAILLAKHLYGGLGYNPFNPAMVGYVVLLISFPVQMTSWAAPRPLADPAGLVEALRACFLPQAFDAVTMATPLDVLKHNDSLSFAQLAAQSPQFGRWAGLGWEWAALAFLAGGLWLLHRRIFTWHAPVAMLASLALMATLFHAQGGPPLFHLLGGATLFGAFFIVTDPVSSAVSVRGRLVFGALIGCLVYVIRVWGNYPDAVAFAVLFANLAAPFIDQYTQPRAYGHGRAGGSH